MRFRLLSYMAAMLLLAGVMGANLTPRTEYDKRVFDGGMWTEIFTRHGWPKDVRVQQSVSVEGFPFAIDGVEDVSIEPSWDYSALVGDFIVGLAIPIVGLLACEFVFRRWGQESHGKVCDGETATGA
jgi:hypothetical protein